MPSPVLTDEFSQLSWHLIKPPVGVPAIEIWCCQLLCPLPVCAGNKWLKLKHHIKHIQQTEKAGIFTFGGAHSNHLAAVAAAARHFGLTSVAMVRQQHHALTPTLAFCQSHGMQLKFVDAEQYRRRHQAEFLQQIATNYPDLLLVPEGGSSALGVQGVSELNLQQTPHGPADALVTACASGGTAAGLSRGHPELPVLAIPVVKDSSLPLKLKQLGALDNIKLIPEVTQLRYGRFNDDILQMCMQLSHQGIGFEPVYTGKAIFSLFHLLRSGDLAALKRVVFFHTGGLQGLAGLQQKALLTAEQYQQLNKATAPE